MSEFEALREIVTEPWPYRFTYTQYWEARKRLGLGVGIRTNGEGQQFTGHLNLRPEPPRAPFAGNKLDHR
jgi:hypothetical protein